MTVSTRLAGALVPPALVAVRLMVAVPEVVGVPERRPVSAFRESPAGRPVAAKELGLLLAVMVPSGMIAYDLCRNLWAPEGATISSGLLPFILEVFQ